MVGLIPLFATEVVDQRLLAHAPRFARTAARAQGRAVPGAHHLRLPGLRRTSAASTCWPWSITPCCRASSTRLLDEKRVPLAATACAASAGSTPSSATWASCPGIGEAMIEYVPGESTSPLFGGNSNWRGPIWLPVNYLLIQAIEKFHRFLGDGFRVAVPCLGGRELDPERDRDADRRAAGRPLPPRRRTRRRRRCRAGAVRAPIRTGATCCCSTSTSTARPGRGWAPRTRPAGPGCSPTWSCAATARTSPPTGGGGWPRRRRRDAG